MLDVVLDNSIKSFREKQSIDAGSINGGFMVCSPKIFNYIDGDKTVFEKEPLEAVAHKGGLMAFKHNGFWQCMDTQRDKQQLEELWSSGNAKWKKW